MDTEEKTPQQSAEQQDEGQPVSLSRRQFLIGASTGLVVGAAGAAGVLTVISPAKPAEEVKVTQTGPATATKVEEVEERLITLKVNGRDYKILAKARSTLADVLRYQLGLTGAHIGCNRAECGACTVAMDGKNIYSCTQMAFASEGHEITTIEGLAKNTSSLEGLHPIQRAFATYDGGQCNFCIPGQIMSTYALLQTNKNPTEADVRRHLSGNICRCGNYQHIVAAVQAAAKEMRG